MLLKCSCGYAFDYQGDSIYYATCLQCSDRIPINRAVNIIVHESYVRSHRDIEIENGNIEIDNINYDLDEVASIIREYINRYGKLPYIK